MRICCLLLNLQKKYYGILFFKDYMKKWGFIEKKFFAIFVNMMNKRVILSSLLTVFLLAFVACKPSEIKPKVKIEYMKMAEWPGFLLKDAVEWYVTDAVWTVSDSHSVAVSGKALFRDSLVNIVIQALLPANDSLWALKMFIDGRAADSSETENIYDNMARGVANALYQSIREGMTDSNLTKQELSPFAKFSLAMAMQNCKSYISKPESFKKMEPIKQSERVLHLSECVINNTSNKEVVGFYAKSLKTARLGFAATYAPKKTSFYLDELIAADSSVMKLYGLKNENGVLKREESEIPKK